MSYLMLDLYCCGGAASKGYHDAGFEVIGVDIEEHENYPYQFVKSDAISLMMDNEEWIGKNISFIHASPPCQKYSRLKNLSHDVELWDKTHVDLVDPTREVLQYFWKKYKIPYVIENVVGAPLINPIKLCGSQFDGIFTQRPRLFESCLELKEPAKKPHNFDTGSLGTISDNGIVSICGKKPLRGLNEVQTKLYYGIALGGVDWLDLQELTQAIPPKYTEFIGKQAIEYLNANQFDFEKFCKLVCSYL